MFPRGHDGPEPAPQENPKGSLVKRFGQAVLGIPPFPAQAKEPIIPQESSRSFMVKLIMSQLPLLINIKIKLLIFYFAILPQELLLKFYQSMNPLSPFFRKQR